MDVLDYVLNAKDGVNELNLLSFAWTKESDVKQPPDEISNSVIFPVVCFLIGRKHLNLQV